MVRALWLVVVAACGIESGEPAPTDEHGVPLPSAGTATLRPGTVILPASLTIDAVTDLTNVVLPFDDALLELERGNIIVSGTGDGFVRRVYAVEPEGERIRIVTSPAMLTDAVESATFALATTDRLVVPMHNDSYNDSVLATIDGDVDITSTIELSLALGPDGLQRFDLHVAGAGTAAVKTTAEFFPTTHGSWGEVYDAQTTIFRRAYALGPLPIVVVGRLTTQLSATGYFEMPVKLEAGAQADIRVDAATTFVPGMQWILTDGGTADMTAIGPVHAGAGRASLGMGIVPELELAIYGVGGPTLRLQAQTQATGTPCGDAVLTSVVGGVFGEATLDVQALQQLAPLQVTLFDVRPLLDDFEACNP